MKKTFSHCASLCLFSSLFLVAASCYRMPEEDEFSLVPTTNNPAITHERNDSMVPAVSY